MAVNVNAVAKAAGVSPSTVSRVLNHNPDIALETAERVRKEAQRLGYRRTSARGRPANWKSKRTGNIALLVPDIHQQALRTVLMGRILEGAEGALRAERLNLLLAGLEPDGALPPCLEPPQVDGLIVRMVRVEASLRAFERRLPEIPRVWVLEPPLPPTRGDIVHSDNEAVAQLALRYLLKRNCHYAVVYQALPEHPATRARAEAFVRAATAAGIQVRTTDGLDGGPAERASGPRSAATACGFFVPVGDEHAERLYRALAGRGMLRGGRARVVSCNNDPARLWALDPSLPSIDIRGEEIGKAAAELLVWRIRHPAEPQRRVLIAPVLIHQARNEADVP